MEKFFFFFSWYDLCLVMHLLKKKKRRKKPYYSLLFEIDLGGWFLSAQLTSPKSVHSHNTIIYKFKTRLSFSCLCKDWLVCSCIFVPDKSIVDINIKIFSIQSMSFFCPDGHVSIAQGDLPIFFVVVCWGWLWSSDITKSPFALIIFQGKQQCFNLIC